MKRMQLVAVVALSLIALIFVSAQTRKIVEVTKQTLARQPRSKPYVMDLTRKGKTYTVAADVANRVRIRTVRGETAMTDLLTILELSGSGFLVARLEDLSAANLRRPGGRTLPRATVTAFKCKDGKCVCNPSTADCLELSPRCESILYCFQACTDPSCSPAQSEKLICYCDEKKTAQ